MAILNEALAKRQNISDEQRVNLQFLYKKLDDLIREEQLEERLSDKNVAKDYVRRMQNIEFQLQENWNFSKDPLCHTWWNSFDNCRCPKMDNNERFGHEKIHRQDCPFHGFESD